MVSFLIFSAIFYKSCFCTEEKETPEVIGLAGCRAILLLAKIETVRRAKNESRLSQTVFPISCVKDMFWDPRFKVLIVNSVLEKKRQRSEMIYLVSFEKF